MKISIVTTLYYSEDFIQNFYSRIKEVVQTITHDYEIIFVNDGSPDTSLQLAIELQKQDSKIVVVDLSRNFGHHRAIMTGLQEAKGEFIFLIDSDLEENPELLSIYWDQLKMDGDCDVVYGIQDKRKGGLIERISGRIWYFLFSFLSDIDYPTDSLTARLMSRRYVDNVLQYKEKELEIWGIFVLTGFNQKAIKVSKGSKGSSTYTLRRKIKIMIDSVTSFSSKPLIYIFLLGLTITFMSAIYISYLVIIRLLYNEVTEGWTSTLVSIWFIGGLLIFCVGIIGIYLSKMFLEIKNRPLTIVRKIYKGNS
jgi:putative glycosyltransferase